MKAWVLLGLFLSGCTPLVKPVAPEPVTVTQVSYVIRLPPAPLLTLPPPVPPIDVDTAKQSEVAEWLLKKQVYTEALENMLRGLAVFFAQQQVLVDQEADAKNAQLKQVAAAAQAQEAGVAGQKPLDLSATK